LEGVALLKRLLRLIKLLRRASCRKIQ
jgi:hypothetical protein